MSAAGDDFIFDYGGGTGVVDVDGVDDASVVGVGGHGLSRFQGVDGDDFAAGDYSGCHFQNSK